MAKTKIEQLGLQSRVFEAMKKEGFSPYKLKEDLERDGHKISVPSIYAFIGKSKEAQKEVIRTDLRAASEYKKLTLDYSKALKDILNEVEEVKNTVKDEKDYTTYNQLIGRLMQGLELIAKLTGDISPTKDAKVDITVIYNQINEKIEKDIKEVDVFELKDDDFETM